mmetsp:Transcript_118157/g.338968  ORF Transcript_118157/g.338968 Transcript_118157/m.338968 type:complete len:279 (+) Transcript_118157:1-837(+)
MSKHDRRWVRFAGESTRLYVRWVCSAGSSLDSARLQIATESMWRNLVGSLLYLSLARKPKVPTDSCVYQSQGVPGAYISHECSRKDGAIHMSIGGATRKAFQAFGPLWSSIHLAVGGESINLPFDTTGPTGKPCSCTDMHVALVEAALVLQYFMERRGGQGTYIFLNGVAGLDLVQSLRRFSVHEHHPSFHHAKRVYDAGGCLRKVLEGGAVDTASSIGQLVDSFKEGLAAVPELVWAGSEDGVMEKDAGALRLGYRFVEDVLKLVADGHFADPNVRC